MKQLPASAWLFLALALLALGGCEDHPFHLQLEPLNVEGRDGGGSPPSYAALMRIGAVAHANGDLSNAVSVYRRAAEIEPEEPAPFVALGNTLLEMGSINEAIRAFNSALARDKRDPEALRGLTRAYLKTGRPELADHPLSIAYQDAPNDPKLLLLIGVANDYTGHHDAAQAQYRRGLELAPSDPALTTDLALSLALDEKYAEAVTVLRPLATAPSGTPGERQTLALIYGLQGDRPNAEQMARRDLDPASVEHNLSFYDTLRNLSPDARSRAILSASAELSVPPRS
ncbi:MAG: tetratricopeptide repeat protein [Alphaproteobacteria bacterium]|nr:tetratricopeptide repeat protein [Alphaproteobacteria bacterium]